jgi:hypothetical protein
MAKVTEKETNSWADQQSKYQKIDEGELENERSRLAKLKFDELRAGPSWYDDEYEKHVGGLRGRYPMLTSLLMRPPARNTANLSTIENTNKYARLADAYNAQLRYVQPDIQIGRGADVTLGKSSWTQVPKLESVDRDQMQYLRDTQGKMRDYMTTEESHYQRELLKRKMDEMQKLVDQGYKQEFYKADELMRQTSALFDSWRDMDDQEFLHYTDQIGIPRAKANMYIEDLKSGDFMKASIAADALGMDPMTAAQVYSYQVASNLVQRMMNDPTPNPAYYAREIGKLSGYQVIGNFGGLIEAAKDPALGPTANKVAATAETAINGISDLAAEIGGHAKGYAIAVAIFAVLKTIGVPVAEAVLKAVAPKIQVVK